MFLCASLADLIWNYKSLNLKFRFKSPWTFIKGTTILNIATFILTKTQKFVLVIKKQQL